MAIHVLTVLIMLSLAQSVTFEALIIFRGSTMLMQTPVAVSILTTV